MSDIPEDSATSWNWRPAAWVQIALETNTKHRLQSVGAVSQSSRPSSVRNMPTRGVRKSSMQPRERRRQSEAQTEAETHHRWLSNQFGRLDSLYYDGDEELIGTNNTRIFCKQITDDIIDTVAERQQRDISRDVPRSRADSQTSIQLSEQQAPNHSTTNDNAQCKRAFT